MAEHIEHQGTKGQSYFQKTQTKDFSDVFGIKGESGARGIDRDNLAKNVEEYFDFFRDSLTAHYQQITNHWKLYMRAHKDKRARHEKWRSLVAVPYPYSGLETTGSGILDLITSANPIITPEAVGDGEQLIAEKMKRYWDYVIRRQAIPKELDLFFREMLVQGIAVRKNAWVRRERWIVNDPSPELAIEFAQALEEAMELLESEPPEVDDFDSMDDFYDAFELWRKEANANGGKLPNLPRYGRQKVVHYVGPGMGRLQIFDFFFDPLMLPKDGPVIQRRVVSGAWMKARTGPEPEKPFDPDEVAKVINEEERSTEDRLNEWQDQLTVIFGLTKNEERMSPMWQRSYEILEFYAPGQPFPYRMVLNRKAVINKDMEIPYEHGEAPYTVLTNLELPFTSVGMSELYQCAPLYKEMNTLRGLRLDAVLMSVLPVFAKMKEAGLTELARRIRPGLILDTARGPQSIGQVTNVQVPHEAFKEITEIKDDIDTTNATQPGVRGAMSPSRTTATASERAVQSSAIRTAQRVLRIEGDLSLWVEHSLSLMREMYDSEERVRIGGKPDIDPFVKFSSEDFLQSLQMEYAFRGARTAINREAALQAAKDLFTVFVNAGPRGFKPEVMAKQIHAQQDPEQHDAAWMDEAELKAFDAKQREAALQEQEQAAEVGEVPAAPA